MTIQHRIFIVGSPRSGTTLLQSLLAAHESVQGFTESHFFDKGFFQSRLTRRWCVRDALKSRIASFFRENPSTSCCLESEIVDALSGNAEADAATLVGLFDRCAESQGKTAWLEKTPDNVRRVALISGVVRNAVFIHIVRRPVETILSLRKAKAQWGRNNSWFRCFAHWYSAMWYTQRYASLSGHFVVTYEDLTANPDGVIRLLLERLGLPWEEELFEKRVNATQGLVRADEKWKANNFSHIESRAPVSDSLLPSWLACIVRRVSIYDQLRELSLKASPEASK